MTPARLREIAARQIADGQRLLLLADALDGVTAAPGAAAVVERHDRDGLVSIVDAALHLGLRYDACRMRARRGGAIVKFGARRYVWRGWLETQNVRSERTSERKCSHALKN